MAQEVKGWRKPDCSLKLDICKLSTKRTFSRKINEKYGEGGGLNANYQTMEAGFVVSNVLGAAGLKYGEHFIFETVELPNIVLSFRNPNERDVAFGVIQAYQKARNVRPQKATDSCPECGGEIMHQEGILQCFCGWTNVPC